MKNKKVRMWENYSHINGTSYTIEVKRWYGWRQPCISYSDDGTFYNKEEADMWFKELSEQQHKSVIIEESE